MNIQRQVSEIFPVDSHVRVDGQFDGLVKSISEDGEISVIYNGKKEIFKLFERLQLVTSPFEIMMLFPKYDDVTKGNIEDIKNIITANGGFIRSEDRSGKKQLAYRIGEYDEAFYTLITVDSTYDTIQKVNKYCANNDDNIIRYMLIRKGC